MLLAKELHWPLNASKHAYVHWRNIVIVPILNYGIAQSLYDIGQSTTYFVVLVAIAQDTGHLRTQVMYILRPRTNAHEGQRAER